MPGKVSSLSAQWSVESVAKYGRIGMIGVFSPDLTFFPVGAATNKNLTIGAGNCGHCSVTLPLLDLVASGLFDPAPLLTQHEPMATWSRRT